MIRKAAILIVTLGIVTLAFSISKADIGTFGQEEAVPELISYGMPDLEAPTARFVHDRRVFPLFMYKYGPERWETTVHIQNPSEFAVSENLRFVDMDSGQEYRPAPVVVPPWSRVEVTGQDSGLPEGFRGSLDIRGAPVAAVAYYRAPGKNTVALQAQEAVDCTASTRGECGASIVTVPLLFKNFEGWDSWLVVYNMEPSSAATLNVLYQDYDYSLNGRGDQLPETFFRTGQPIQRGWRAVIRPRALSAGRSALIPMDQIQGSSMLTATIDTTVESSTRAGKVVALAFHQRKDSGAEAAYGMPSFLNTFIVPVYFRGYRGVDSDVFVVNTGTIEDRLVMNVGTYSGPKLTQARRTILPGEGFRFKASDVDFPDDNLLSSAVVSSTVGGGRVMAVARHYNAQSGASTLMGSNVGSISPWIELCRDSDVPGCGAKVLYAPVVRKNFAGITSIIQVRNTSPMGNTNSATARFYTPDGQQVSTVGPSQMQDQGTFYFDLGLLGDIPDGFTGQAIIESERFASLIGWVMETRWPPLVVPESR